MDNTGANVYVTCELCGMYGNLLLCSGCRSSWYCSKEHQKSHWNHHREKCRSISSSAGQQIGGYKTNQSPNYGYSNSNQQYSFNQPLSDNQNFCANNQYNPMLAMPPYQNNTNLLDTNGYTLQNEYQNSYANTQHEVSFIYNFILIVNKINKTNVYL